jgi:hypothetical protein
MDTLRKLLFKAIGLIAFLALIACSSQTTLPAISGQATGLHQPGRIVWHDLLTEDADVTQRFYSELFGWEFETVPVALGFGESLNYSIISNKGVPIGGMVDTSGFDNPQNQSQWVSFISTADIEQSVKVLQASGGLLQAGPVDLGARGQLALVADPQGALFALLQTRDGDPVERAPRVGDFIWNELWTVNAGEAESFYQALFNYQAAHHDLAGGASYRYLSSENDSGFHVPRIAIRTNPIIDLEPTWVSYVRVVSPQAIVDQVEALGGQVLLAPQVNDIGGTLAIIVDPSGAGLVVQTWDDNQQHSGLEGE